MNLRVFKKDIEYFVGEFIDDCALFIALNPHKDAEEISDIVDEAVDLYNDLKQRANHPEGNKKAYYTGLTKEMFEKLDTLCEKLSAVVSKQA
jgi:site-specific DNA-adenine methylase